MRNRRRRRFVDSPVQGALIRRILYQWLIFLAVASIMLALVRVWSAREFTASFSTMFLQGWAETAPMLIVLVAMLPMFLWDILKLSHRFAGPMCGFQQTVRRLAAGEEVRPIRLRKGDFWTDFADDLNTLIQRLESAQDREDEESGDQSIPEDEQVLVEACP